MSALVFAVGFCIVAVLVYMARYSGRLRVTQTRVIDAPVAVAYARVIDFRHWHEWSPWLEHAGDARVTLSEPSAGAGSRYAWDSPGGGNGAIEHLRAQAPQRIEQRLRFGQPFPFRGRGSWRFADVGGKTRATWTMKGRVGFSMRAFATTVQGAIALDFRYGLDRLARSIDGAPAGGYTLAYLGLREVPATRYACITHEGPIDGLGLAVPRVAGELRQALARQGVAEAGAPLAVYAKTNFRRRTTVCHVGIPIAGAAVEAMPVRELPAHRAYVVCLRGDRAGLEVAWYQAMQRLRIENLQPDSRITPFERLIGATDAAAGGDTLTELHLPVRPAVSPTT